jgi:hypothetical protein
MAIKPKAGTIQTERKKRTVIMTHLGIKKIRLMQQFLKVKPR